jgi:hypothetical protein
MEEHLPVPGWNAHRHPSSPIAQPKYRFQDVPKCVKSLEGSVIEEVTGRDAFKQIMGEMVLLCTEAMKRSRAGRTASKPLSLEYIADRLDVDDPCFGYVIRSAEGHLQGFITVTTFTNWQKNFKWDSLHEVSFYYDHDDTHAHAKKNVQNDNAPQTPTKRPHGKRVIDEDGSLARELQKTVRLGDPYNEGIVWPRIAEISLLGALGCGKALVQLVIEHLEFQRASASANYDYIALQATDNSIPFYESQGFVRVGAVTYDSDKDEDSPSAGEKNRSISPTFSTDSTASETTTSSSASSGAVEAVELPQNSPEKPEAIALPQAIVSSPHFVHEVVRPGQTPSEIAKIFQVDVWDIIFLNKDIYKDLRPTSRLIKGTLLHVPQKPEDDEGSSNNGPKSPGSPTKWFVAKENDTPRQIAKRHGLACNKLVSANRRRLPELQANSRLKAGTRIKVSNLDQIDEICQPYCHWSFPEDTAVEGGEPSYMMVYKLDRKTARNPRVVRDSFAAPVGKHTAPKLLFPPPPKTSTTDLATATAPAAAAARSATEATDIPTRKNASRNRKLPPPGPKLPKQPPQPEELMKPPPESGKDVYWEHQRELHPELITPTPENEKIIKDRWSRLAGFKKERYHSVAAEARKIYERINREYQAELSKWKKACQKLQGDHKFDVQQRQAEAVVSASKQADKQSSLYNKVIKLRDDAIEGKEYKYYFVLTYIPDLKWVHLAPMCQEGYFGPDRKKSYGRPLYRLVDEKLGKELDISSSYCIPVKSKALKRTADADKEEWDILDGPVDLMKEDGSDDPMDTVSTTSTITSSHKKLSKQPKFRARSAIKPLSGKIAVGTTPRHSQDPLNRTRSSPLPSSPSPKKRPHDEISSDEKSRNRRRCMRCIEFGASLEQAVSCLGAKGRFGRDACQHFEENGSQKSKSNGIRTPGSGRKPRRCTRCLEFGATDVEAAECPGAKGRLGKTACDRFTSTGKRKVPEVHSEGGITSEEESVGEPQKKKQRLETKVLVGKNQQIEVVLSPSKCRPSRRPDVSPARPGPRWSTANQSTATASRKSSRVHSQ